MTNTASQVTVESLYPRADLEAYFDRLVESPAVENANFDIFLLPAFAAFIALEHFKKEGNDEVGLEDPAVKPLEDAARCGIDLAFWNEHVKSEDEGIVERDKNYYLSMLSSWLVSREFSPEQLSAHLASKAAEAGVPNG